MPRIDYGAGLVIDIPEGMTILEASLQHGLDHRAACGADVRCTTCRVEVVEGAENCSPVTRDEQDILREQLASAWPLALPSSARWATTETRA